MPGAEILARQSGCRTSWYVIMYCPYHMQLLYAIVTLNEIMADSTEGLSLERVVVEAVKEMGYEAIKQEQMEAILSFLNKKDVFVVLPTGYGKSLCFGALPKIFDKVLRKSGSIALIISPLVALMNDQVASFQSKGVSAVRVGDCSPDTNSRIIEGEYQLVFISPEAILSRRRWRKMLLSDVYQRNLIAIVIDEAHCVKKW